MVGGGTGTCATCAGLGVLTGLLGLALRAHRGCERTVAESARNVLELERDREVRRCVGDGGRCAAARAAHQRMIVERVQNVQELEQDREVGRMSEHGP